SCETLKAGLDDVVVVLAVQVFDVEGHSRRLGKGLEPLLEQLGVHLAQLRPGKHDLPDQIGAVRGVEADPGQGLVHRDHRMPIARDAGAIAEGAGDRFADDVTGVLGGVMKVDVQIAHRMQRNVDQAVLGKLLQHVVEKPDAGRHLGSTAAVEFDPTADLGLLGVAFDRRHPPGAPPLVPPWRRRPFNNFTGPLPLSVFRGLEDARLAAPTPLAYISISLVPSTRSMAHYAKTDWHGTTIL